jgi:uncharacterized protein YggT (Ycf19 family)
MEWLNLIMDLAALVLWLNWRQAGLEPLAVMAPATLAGTLKRTETAAPKRWKFGVALAVLLLARAWLYLQLAGVANLSPRLRLGFVNIPFRANLPLDMLVFSLLSFGFVLAAFYLWMLLLSTIDGGATDSSPVARMVRLQIPWAEHWPRVVKWLSPFLLGGIAWAALHPLLWWLAAVPESKSVAQLVAQAVVHGLGTYVVWEYLILGVLLVHFVNAQAYLGALPFWNYADTVGRNLLSPFRRLPLRIGRVDFLPLVVMALVIILSHLVENPPDWLCRQLPF